MQTTQCMRAASRGSASLSTSTEVRKPSTRPLNCSQTITTTMQMLASARQTAYSTLRKDSRLTSYLAVVKCNLIKRSRPWASAVPKCIYRLKFGGKRRVHLLPERAEGARKVRRNSEEGRKMEILKRRSESEMYNE